MCTIHIHKYMIYANLIDELLCQNEFYGVLRTFVHDLGLIATYMQSISSFPPWNMASLPQRFGSSMRTKPRLPHNASCVPVSLINRFFISKIGISVGLSF